MVAVLALTTATAAWSADWPKPTTLSINGGYGNDVDAYGMEAHWDSFCSCAWLKSHGLDTRLSAELAYWNARPEGSLYPSLVTFGLTPMVRWTAGLGGVGRLYVDGGIGLRLLSHTQIDKRQLGLAAQFGERIGTGLVFGAQDRYEAGIFVQHVSNGSMKAPNNGITYFGLNFGVKL